MLSIHFWFRIALAGLVTLAWTTHGSAADGDFDPSFGVLGQQVVEFADVSVQRPRVAIAPDGRVYLAGGTGLGRITVSRLLRDGAIDTGFGVSGRVVHSVFTDVTVNAMGVQSDGKVLVAGTSRVSEPENYDAFVCRFLVSGEPDPSFGTGEAPGCVRIMVDLESLEVDFGYALLVQRDGKLVIGGSARQNHRFRPFVYRLLANGTPDLLFGVAGLKVLVPDGQFDETVRAVAEAPDGKLVIATEALGDIRVFRIDGILGATDPDFGAGGSWWVSFDVGGGLFDQVAGLVVDRNGGVTVAAQVAYAPQLNKLGVARLTRHGQFDLDFGSAGRVHHFVCDVCSDTRVGGVQIQSDGRIVLAGTVQGDGFNPDSFAMRLLPNGTKDASFGGGGVRIIEFDLATGDDWDTGYGVALQAGRVVVATKVELLDDSQAVNDVAAAAPRGGGFKYAMGATRLQIDLIYTDDFGRSAP